MSMGMSKVRAQGMGGKPFFPASGRQLFGRAGQVVAYPLKDIDQVGIGIDAVQTTGDQQALDHAHVPGARLAPVEQPVAP